MSTLVWRHAGGVLDCTNGHLVGIVNATPDSFTDEGRHFGTDASVAHGERLAAEGASIVEVGGESLRFSAHTDVAEEIARVVPVIERLVASLDVPVAIDTFKPAVAEAAIAAGASILNDPTGLRDPEMTRIAAAGGVGVVLTHFFGEPKVRPESFPDVDVPEAILAWGRDALAAAVEMGIDPECIVIDPGVGRCSCRSPTRRSLVRSPGGRRKTAWHRPRPGSRGAGSSARGSSASTTWRSCATCS
jgi:dihydropteroate synthase